MIKSLEFLRGRANRVVWIVWRNLESPSMGYKYQSYLTLGFETSNAVVYYS